MSTPILGLVDAFQQASNLHVFAPEIGEAAGHELPAVATHEDVAQFCGRHALDVHVNCLLWTDSSPGGVLVMEADISGTLTAAPYYRTSHMDNLVIQYVRSHTLTYRILTNGASCSPIPSKRFINLWHQLAQ